MIRPAQIDDVPAIARVQVDTWRTTYTGIVPAEHLVRLDYAHSVEKWRQVFVSQSQTRLFVAEDEGGQVVGFACGGPGREPQPALDGELYAIYVLQAHQGRGLGRGLVAAVATDLYTRGFKSLLIWVLKDNPSRGFYEALGGQIMAHQEIDIGGASLAEVGYGWLDLASLVAGW
jgi:L-amino acid N-acyltransferase YncA